MDKINYEKLISEIAISTSKELISKGGKIAASKIAPLQNKLRLGFNRYLSNIYAKCSQTKTLLHGSTPTSLFNIYVNSGLQKDSKSFTDLDLIQDTISRPVRFIFTGTAGSGKSMLMKFFTLSLIQKQDKKLPIFFELRKLNKEEKDEEDLLKAIWSEFPKNNPLTYDRFISAMSAGLFYFIFDGLDEVDYDKKNWVEEQIRSLSSDFSNNSFMISSRPEESLYSWHSFEVYEVSKMSLDSVINLVNKIEYDVDQKEAFVSDLKAGLYQKHEDFLSIPLLATMMLLTYQQYAKVPEKIHIFYGQVFEVLFNRHDVRKDGKYERKFYTKLPMDDFSTVFQTFCAMTYLKEKYFFDRQTALKFLGEAISYCNINVNKVDFLEDLTKSICLLVQEGPEIKFSHRSFQEYFTALFISNSKNVDLNKILPAIENRVNTDSVVNMLFGIDREYVESNYVIPETKIILDKSNQVIDSKLAGWFLHAIFQNSTFIPIGKIDENILEKDIFMLIATPNGIINFKSTKMFLLISMLIQWYPDFFERLPSKETGGDVSVLRQYGVPLIQQFETIAGDKPLELSQFNFEGVTNYYPSDNLVVSDIASIIKIHKALKSMVLKKEQLATALFG